MIAEEVSKTIRDKYLILEPLLDERSRRIWAATEARALGHGGITAVAKAIGIGRRTIWEGLEEINDGRHFQDLNRIRHPGGGRRDLTKDDPTLLEDLDRLIDPTTRGDPTSPLRWTCKSLRSLEKELREMGHDVGRQKLSELLHEMGFSLQGTRKTREGKQHLDRNAQFEHIAEKSQEFMERGQPVISVDTKKKELIGEFQNNGKEWQPEGIPEEVNVHDFPSDAKGKAIPYGVYDMMTNTGWVSVGIDHDTAEFAVESIRRWWQQMGRVTYPDATGLLITADSGGSNGSKPRLWKLSLQKLADETGLSVTVLHYPPGTSKWNKIEHRMFCHITRNWRGQPLTSFETVVNLIADTTTEAGLKIQSALDTGKYATKIKITKKEMAAVNLTHDSFHGDWNYTISPSTMSVD
jgi:transposase